MDYNGQSGEQVLRELETRAVATATQMWFERDPYIAAVYSALTPDDRNALIEKVRADAAEAGFMQLDADKWLSHHVNKMYDEGKLPEIEKAQKTLAAQVEAVDEHLIQTLPMKTVNALLTEKFGSKRAPNVLPTSQPSEVMTLEKAIADDEVRQAEAKKESRQRPDISGLMGWNR